MGKNYDSIAVETAEWIGRQKMFFVSTAPLSASGHVNCSPKGGDSFRILGPNEVVYQDYTGTGAETAAHLRENGRIVVMFCAFEGPPKIVRLHGTGAVIRAEDARYENLISRFPPHAGTRCVMHIKVTRVSDSCGFSVPLYTYNQPRDILDKWSASRTTEQLLAFRRKHGLNSIDGLPAFDL
jgi:hypothetical protein